MITLNGQILEGGGQILRNAIALAALTNQPLSIHSIRGSRPGKKGLKASHLAAVQSLAEISNSVVEGAKLRSETLSFYPPAPTDIPHVKQEYSIKLDTPGSVFLVFQALYPYLLRAGALAGVEGPIRVDITGGTNVTFSPSFDYVQQVLVPNLKTLGFPGLSVEVQKRGWMTGPVELGTVRCLIDPLPSTTKPDGSVDCRFPPVDLNKYRRGIITQIDITVLAPDDEVPWPTTEPSKHDKLTIREYIEQETITALHNSLNDLPPHIINLEDPQSPTLINIHTSERTHHRTLIYVLLVGHTTTGFRIGRDFLLSDAKDPRPKSKKCDKDSHQHALVKNLIESCVADFENELWNQYDWFDRRHQPCVDEYMRDQLVIFEALGRLYPSEEEEKDEDEDSLEDERYWSLHTKTARWVCKEFGLKLNR